MEILFATPDEAEAAFYQAFARADLDEMMRVWADDDGISCIHPLSPRIEGRAGVKASWSTILGEGMQLEIRLAAVRRVQDALLAIHTLQEHLSVAGDQHRFAPMVATNIYQLTKQGWRMIAHHASPSEPPQVEQTQDDSDRATLH